MVIGPLLGFIMVLKSTAVTMGASTQGIRKRVRSAPTPRRLELMSSGSEVGQRHRDRQVADQVDERWSIKVLLEPRLVEQDPEVAQPDEGGGRSARSACRPK